MVFLERDFCAAGATLGVVGVSLFVAGATYIWCRSASFCGRRNMEFGEILVDGQRGMLYSSIQNECVAEGPEEEK